MSDPRAIAAKLPKGQGDFLASPLYYSLTHGITAALFHDTRFWAGRELARKGLVERRCIEPGTVASVLTPLGEQVRTILMEQSA